eukprot:1155846-Pyramimonas_sp.AAC.1
MNCTTSTASPDAPPSSLTTDAQRANSFTTERPCSVHALAGRRACWPESFKHQGCRKDFKDECLPNT